MKYKEKEILQEVEKYIESTYSQHYVGKNNIQSLDLIFSSGHGEGFCMGSIHKYAARYGKKKGKNRADLLKIVHYGILMLYLNELEEEKENKV
jgi:hypothetical protein